MEAEKWMDGKRKVKIKEMRENGRKQRMKRKRRK